MAATIKSKQAWMVLFGKIIVRVAHGGETGNNKIKKTIRDGGKGK